MSYAAAVSTILIAGVVAAFATALIQGRVEIDLRRRHHDVGSVIFLLEVLFQDVANLQLSDPDQHDKKAEILSLLAQAHAHRETRNFQANSGIPVPLWCVLIAFTIMLALFVSFSGIQYRTTAAAIAACFTVGIVSILVIARLLNYPFEGALALRPTDFIEAIGKISDLLSHVKLSEH